MPELATAWVSIVADTSRIPGQIRQAFGQTDRIAQQQGQQAGRSFSGAFGTSLKAAGAIAGAAGGIAAIGAAMRSSIGAGMDFTGALNTMQAVSGATAQQVAEVGRRARELGTDSQLAATSSVDAANAMLELAKGGFTVEQSMQAARGTLQLAAAAQISAAEAATIQSQALQAFGQDATYAGKTADILANAANASSAEITDVAQALQQSGTVANQFGLSMSDTAASIALLANAGIKGSDAGTLLKSTLLALTDQSDQAETVMKQLGLTVYDAQGRFVGMESLFGQLNAASERMTDQQYQQATAILFGSDAMRLSGLAAQVGADGFSQMRAAMEKSGSAADVAAAKMQGLPGAWEKLKNSAQDAGLAFYDVVEGPLTTAANAAADLLGDLVSDSEKAASGIGRAFDNERVQSFLQSVKDNGSSAFVGITQAAVGIGSALGEGLEAAGMIAGALGVSTWTVFLETVRAATGVLQTLTPVLSSVASFTSDNAALATAMVGAFLAWRLIPPVMGRVQSALSPVTTALGNARTSAQNFIATNTAMSQGLASNRTLMMQMAGVMQNANGRWQTLSGQYLTAAQAMQRLNAVAASGVTNFGRFGSAISQMGSHMPVLARMQAAFVNTATSANQFGRTLGTLNAGMTGFRAGGSALLGAFGGPLGAAITGAIAYLGLAAAAHAENTQKARAQSQAVKDLAASEVALGSALSQSRGAMSQDVWGKAGEQISAYQNTLKTTADQHKSTWDQFKEIGGIGKILLHTNDELNDNSQRAMAAQKAMSELKMTNDDLARSLYGTDGQWKTTTDRLVAMGEGGVKAAAELTGMRNEFLQQRDIASRITPGVSELGDAIRLMGDNGASASDKLNALKTAMDAMNPARNKTEAMAQYGDTIRKAAEAAAGIDATAFRGGNLDALSESGSNLSRTLSELAEKSAQVASSGGDMNAVTARNEEMFRQLATATNQPIEKIRQLYAELGGTAVDLSVHLKGAPEVTQQLAAISAQWNTVPEQKSIEIRESAVNAETRAALERMKIQVSEPKNGVVTITANDTAARASFLMITQNMSVLNALKANPQLDLNSSMFRARSSEAIAALQGLDRTQVSPQAGLIIDKLLQGKQVSMAELNTLSQSSANPAVNLMIDQLLKNAAIANQKLDEVARRRDAYIDIRERWASGDQVGRGVLRPEYNPGMGGTLPTNADGSIRTYANGGIAALEKYANGGHLTEPQILPGRGAGSLYTTAMGPAIAAEGETGGEAWIPLGPGKRGRSTSLLATVADLFGFSLVPQDQMPNSISGLIGAVTGGAVKHALKGVDGVRKFADGAVLRRLADGEGASRPLTGAPYVWGGVNWGDCCLTSENSVWTPDGAVPMDKIKPGDRVWSYVDGKLEAHEVTAAWFSKTQEVFKVRTRHRSVTGSANHPFLRLVQTSPAKPRAGARGWEPAEYGVEWARLDELNPGDLLVQPKAPRLEFESNTIPSGREIGLNEAWLLGLILGDGNVSDTKVEICVYGDLRERARGVLSGMAMRASKTRGARTGIGSSDSDAHGIRAYSTEFARELDEAGFRKPAHEKRIPDCVWGWDEERQRAFLNGYCDADGHHPADVARYGERTYASSSRELIEDVRYLHIALGDVVANVSTNRRAKPITIRGKRVQKARPLHAISVRPQGEELVGSVAARRRPGVAMWHDTTDFTIAPVLSITAEGEQDTYDIEVEGAHNFIAGGIVVHNSGAMSAFARKAVGLDPFGGRFSTATMGDQIVQMGGQLGRGGSGDMRFGWVNGGPGGGHTAGTLPDGTNVEMGGGNGGGMVGGSAAGADDPQFVEHAFIPVAPSYDPGTGVPGDDGGWVQRPDGTWAQTGPGGYDATGGSFGAGASSGGSGSGDDKTLSGRLGNAANAFVSGQISSLFDVLSINDQPGWLAAITEYENQQRSGSQGGSSVSPADRERAKAEYDAAKDSLKSDYEAAKLSRKQDYDQKKQALENEFTLKKIDRGTYERKLNDLKHRYEQDELAKKQEYDSRVAEAKSRYDSATGKTPKPGEPGSDPSAALGLKQRYEDEKLARKQQYDQEREARRLRYEADKKALAEEKKNGLGEEAAKRRADELKMRYDSDLAGMKTRYESAELQKKQEFERASKAPNMGAAGGGQVTDPGTVKPRPGEDLGRGGAGAAGTGNAIKDAFRSGLREAWRQGPPWEATDWIINKESTWNPNARNGKYFGLGQFSPEVWAAAGKTQTADARTQGEVFDHYVGSPRYGDPLAAKAHHEANNWYDKGGIADGIGVMQKNVLKPERVLSPTQTEAFEQGMRNGFGGGELGVKIDRMIELLQVVAQQPRGQVNYNLRDEQGLKRAERAEKRRTSTALAGR